MISSNDSSRTLERQPWIVPAIAGIIGAAAMTWCLGPSIVDPRNFEWLMHGDYGLHFLGWHLYRHGPWTWPIGATPLLIWPVGSSIGLTDSIPILAFFFKPLDALLPQEFQFIGLWLVLSVTLQGVFGALLMRLATPRASLQLLGAALFILSPPLLYRINHAALTAHWLVLAALWLTFGSDRALTLRTALAWAALCAATAAIQPYVLLMVAVLMAAAHLQHVLAAPRQIVRVALSGVGAVAAAFLSLWQSGSLMVRAQEGLEVGGFGEWSTNLLTFIMPTEGPTLFSPGWFPYHHKEQYEGYGYLGAGMLLLALMVVAARLTSRTAAEKPASSLRRRWPLFLALLFLGAMALGPQITAGPNVVFVYSRSWWDPLRIFRTSGRMVWPVYYTVFAAILFAAVRLPPRRAVWLCTIALVVQAIDVSGMVNYVRDVRFFGFRDPLQNPFWRVVPKSYDGMVLVPSNLCSSEGYLDFLPFALHAGNSGIGVNGGITARYDVVKARQYCRELRGQLRDGDVSDRSLYVVRLDLVPAILEQSRGKLVCTSLDGFGACFTPGSISRWQERFDIPRSRVPDIAELLRFHGALDDVYRSVLGRGARDAAGPTAARLEALARYLSYRLEGCGHEEAESRTLPHLTGVGDHALCSRMVLVPEMPAADQTLAFLRRAAEVLAPRATAVPTAVDAEGEAVWMQAYIRERIRGAREVDARATVLAAIKGGG